MSTQPIPDWASLDLDADLPRKGQAPGKHAAGPWRPSEVPVPALMSAGDRVREAAYGLFVTGPVVVPGWWAIWKVCDKLWLLILS